MTRTKSADYFVMTDNFISTLDEGKLKILLSDTKTLRIYHFCIKVTDDSGYGYSKNFDDLSLEVKKNDKVAFVPTY